MDTPAYSFYVCKNNSNNPLNSAIVHDPRGQKIKRTLLWWGWVCPMLQSEKMRIELYRIILLQNYRRLPPRYHRKRAPRKTFLLLAAQPQKCRVCGISSWHTWIIHTILPKTERAHNATHSHRSTCCEMPNSITRDTTSTRHIALFLPRVWVMPKYSVTLTAPRYNCREYYYTLDRIPAMSTCILNDKSSATDTMLSAINGIYMWS